MKNFYYILLNIFIISFLISCNSTRYLKYQNRAYKKIHHRIEKTSDFQTFNEFQKDFLILAHIVKDAYPNYQEFLSEEEWQKSVDETIRNLKQADMATAVFEYQKFLAQLKNNHTEVTFPSLFKLEEKIFLLAPYFLNGRWIIFDVHQSYPETLIKSELLAINDFPVDTVYNKIKNYICAESPELTYHSAYSDIMFGRPNLLNYLGLSYANSCDSLKLTVKDTLQNIHTFFVPAINIKAGNIAWNKNGFGTRQSIVKTDSGYVYRFFPEYKTAYLQINTFIDRRAMVIGIKDEVPIIFRPFAFSMLRKAYNGQPSPRMRMVKPGTENITAFYEDFFTKLKESNCENLVIDVRNNSGGDIFYTYQLISFLTERTDLKTFSRYIKFSDLYKQMEDTKEIEQNFLSLEKTKIAYDTLINISTLEEDENIFEKMKDPDFEYYVNSHDKVFKGKVYILTSHYSASAATALPVMIQDNNLGVIVGRTPANRTAKQSSFTRFRLPNSSIVINFSTLYFVRPDRENSNEILLPDHIVPVQLSNEDYTFQFLLNLIKNEEKK